MIRVAVVAESPVTKAGLEAMLAKEDRFLLVDTGTANGGPAIEDIDVIVAVTDDGTLPPLDTESGVPLVVIAEALNPPTTARLLRDGATAVLLHDTSPEQLEAAVAAAAVGLVTVPAEMSFATVVVRADATPALQPLTPREAEVLNLIAGGSGNKAIAARLTISEHTVKSHVESIFEKLGVSSRAEAVTRGVQLGVVLV